MARGDIINGLASVAAGGNLDYQPAAGVEVLITAVHLGAGTVGVNVCLYNGTIATSTSIIPPGHTTAYGHPRPLDVKVGITRTNYLRIVNGDGVNARVLGYSGMQTR